MSDIGVFANHHNTAGVSFLRGNQHLYATPADADAIAAAVGATNPTPFVSVPTGVELLPPAARLALMDLADERHHQLCEPTDTKLDLTRGELEAAVGKATVSKMVELFNSRVDEIKVRRVEAGSGEVIKFHIDFSLKVRHHQWPFFFGFKYRWQAFFNCSMYSRHACGYEVQIVGSC
jgi:hypothetical protein